MIITIAQIVSLLNAATKVRKYTVNITIISDIYFLDDVHHDSNSSSNLIIGPIVLGIFFNVGLIIIFIILLILFVKKYKKNKRTNLDDRSSRPPVNIQRHGSTIHTEHDSQMPMLRETAFTPYVPQPTYNLSYNSTSNIEYPHLHIHLLKLVAIFHLVMMHHLITIQLSNLDSSN